jgi:hypothetical protein
MECGSWREDQEFEVIDVTALALFTVKVSAVVDVSG